MQNRNLVIGAVAALLLVNISAVGQLGKDSLEDVTHSSSFRFVHRDGTCVFGKLSKADTTSVTVQPYHKPSITIPREGLLQISQGNALLFTARSSWADVSAATLYPREALVLNLKSGKRVKGKPVKTDSDAITLKHGIHTTLYPKSDVATIDYLRVKPATDGFMSILGEAPWILLLDPEFYYRATGLPGRIQVRLFDATKPEDDTPVECKSWR
jgi:hypothetical protein